MDEAQIASRMKDVNVGPWCCGTKLPASFNSQDKQRGQMMTGRACTDQLRSAGAAKKQEKTVIKKGNEYQ